MKESKPLTDAQREALKDVATYFNALHMYEGKIYDTSNMFKEIYRCMANVPMVFGYGTHTVLLNKIERQMK